MHWIYTAINLNYGQGDETNLDQKKVQSHWLQLPFNRSSQMIMIASLGSSSKLSMPATIISVDRCSSLKQVSKGQKISRDMKSLTGVFQHENTF